MIDLHCHMLPGIDDGARDVESALGMARLAVEDGITTVFCTPHIHQGRYENTAAGISSARDSFQAELEAAGIPLRIECGADIQVVPELVAGLQSGHLPTLGGSRYFLLEPHHHVLPPGMLQLIHLVLDAGYVPVITHPERLAYIETHFDVFVEAHRMGAWLQITGGVLLGNWGPRVRGIAERMLRMGLVHALASDGHNLKSRQPVLSQAREAAARIVGDAESARLVCDRPLAVLEDLPSMEVAPPRASLSGQGKTSWIRRFTGL